MKQKPTSANAVLKGLCVLQSAPGLSQAMGSRAAEPKPGARV